MDEKPFHLTILYTSDTIQWCEYVFDIFKEYDVQQNSEDVTDFPSDVSTLNSISNSVVTIVIVSPMFLQKCDTRLADYLNNTVVGLLCGVDERDMEELFTKIPSARVWRQVDASIGSENIAKIILKLLGTPEDPTGAPVENTYIEMNKATGNQGIDDTYLTMTSEPDDNYLTMTSEPDDTYLAMAPECDTYSAMDDLEEEGNYEEMAPSKKPMAVGHGFKSASDGYINMKGAPHMSSCSPGLSIYPEKMRSGVGGLLLLLFKEPLTSAMQQDQYDVKFSGKLKTTTVSAVLKNPYMLSVNVSKEHPAEITKVQIVSSSRGTVLGSFNFLITSTMDDLVNILMNVPTPLQFMCQSLGVSPADSNQLDNILHERIQKCLPPNGLNLLVGQVGEMSTVLTEIPTALHFAAKYGLKNICSMLINCPGAIQAMKMKNIIGETPDVMAGKSGHQDLKCFLQNFMEVGEDTDENLSTSYVFMKKGLTQYYKNEEIHKSLQGKVADYDSPFSVAIPSTSEHDEQIKLLVQGKPEDIESYYDSLPLTECSFIRDTDEDDEYETITDQFGNRQRSTRTKGALQRPPKRTETRPDREGSEMEDASRRVQQMTKVQMENMHREKQAAKPNNAQVLGLAPLARGQQELIDLQNSVKNQDIRVEEAVILFKNWELLQSRNELCFKQQSEAYKEKKQKLQAKDNKATGLLNRFKKIPRKGISPTAPAVIIANKQQERIQSLEINVGKNRPTSTTSSASSGSRGSVLSVSDKDSSYGSAVEESDQERFYPAVPPPSRGDMSQEQVSPDTSQSNTDFFPEFSPEYIMKPVPPIPSRTPAGRYQRPAPPIPGRTANLGPAVEPEVDSEDQQSLYIDFDDSPPTAALPPIPGSEQHNVESVAGPPAAARRTTPPIQAKKPTPSPRTRPVNR